MECKEDYGKVMGPSMTPDSCELVVGQGANRILILQTCGEEPPYEWGDDQHGSQAAAI